MVGAPRHQIHAPPHFSVSVEIVRRLCGGCAEIVRRLCGDCAEIVRRLCGDCAEIVRRLCGDCAEIRSSSQLAACLQSRVRCAAGLNQSKKKHSLSLLQFGFLILFGCGGQVDTDGSGGMSVAEWQVRNQSLYRACLEQRVLESCFNAFDFALEDHAT
eukprot:501492-Rhodomonas_salina.1